MPWSRVYTDDQRDAVAYAWCDAQTRPAGKIARQAAAGELTLEGKAIAPFEIPEASVRDIGKREERRRRGLGLSKLADVPHRDAVETVRRRLCAVLDSELERLERDQRKPGAKPIDPVRITKLARAGRELAAMPGPDEPRPSRPAPTTSKERDTSLAGQLRATVQGGGITPPDTTVPPPSHTQGEDTDTQDDESNNSNPTTTHHDTNHTDESSGLAARAEFGGLSVERLTVRQA